MLNSPHALVIPGKCADDKFNIIPINRAGSLAGWPKQVPGTPFC